MKTAQLQQIGRVIEMYYPDIFNEILPVIERPKASLTHVFLLPTLLDIFCEHKNVNKAMLVGIDKGEVCNDLKRLFVAVIIQLYNPEVLTGIHGDKLKDGLRDNLAGMLQCKGEVISVYASAAKVLLNPAKTFGIYLEYKAQVAIVSGVVKNRINVYCSEP